MPNKDAIIDNIESFTAHQLVGYIRSGLVTYDELVRETEGYWPSAVRIEVERMLVSNEEPEWEKVKVTEDPEVIKNFLSNYPESSHRAEARRLLVELEDKLKAKPDEPVKETPPPSKPATDEASAEWQAVVKDDLDSLIQFRDTYPDSPYAREARKLITALLRGSGGIKGDDFSLENLIKELNKAGTDPTITNPAVFAAEKIKEFLQPGRLDRQVFMQGLSEDHNMIKAEAMKILVEEGEIDPLELQQIGIRPEFIDKLEKTRSATGFPPSRRVETIQRVSTEVYFWGIPTSGKTCAIGMILRAASSGRVAQSMREDNSCQGYGYMSRLRELFKVNPGEVGQLPTGTGVHDFYEIGFDLEDNEGKIHPITIIDLAGELIRIMYKNDADEPLNDQQLETLDTLTSLLVNKRSQNRKIHVFVIEYGGENRLYEGLSQETYLRGALNYLDRTQIFNKDTDAIFVMFTMTDRIRAPKSEWINVLEQYTADHYLDFYKGLQRICKEKEINRGRVTRVPFTLGEVCFRDFFIPGYAAADHFVKELIARTDGYTESKISKLRARLGE